jgi:glycopeptide antibiotics resistance protein
VTLLPGDPLDRVQRDRIFCVLCERASLADALANLALFLPLGLSLGWLGSAPRRALAIGAGLSLAIELAQLAIPGRDPSVSDVLFNVLGAGLGALVVGVGRRLPAPDTRQASRLSLVAAAAAAAIFVGTDVLLTTSLPETTYFGGSRSVQTTDTPLRLGGNTEANGFFPGRIDDVRIYRRVLTPAEIRDDMRVPVSAAARRPDLVAAYNFDEAAGTILTDVSSHGNTGRVPEGARWTEGRYRGALAFQGLGDVVIVPHSASLALTDALTLEAWINPTTASRGWRAVLQKEFDAYFLLAGSRAGALRPVGGATFGASTETLPAPAPIPRDAWTHVATTYDGAVLQLYVNGDLVSRRLRWYPGRILEATVDGVALGAGPNAESRQVRARLLAGAPLRVRAVAAAPVPTPAPLVTLHDATRNEILLLAAEGEDLLVRVRSRAAALQLDSPALRATGITQGIGPGEPLSVAVWRSGPRYCIDVNHRIRCGLGFTLGMGWTLAVYSQVPGGWPHTVLNAAWMAALLVPFGFWLRRRWESLAGVLVLALGVSAACALGRLGLGGAEVAGAAAGILGGALAARVRRRV